MYYCCPFRKKYLVDYIAKDEFKNIYYKSYRLLEDNNLQDGHGLLERLIKKNDGLALVIASIFSKVGEGEEDFYQRHFDNILKASEQGNPLVLYSLGAHFNMGEYFDEDKERAFLLFKSAAELGMHQAKHIYGVMQYYGTGGAEKKINLALEMIRGASKEGVDEATEFLEYIGNKK